MKDRRNQKRGRRDYEQPLTRFFRESHNKSITIDCRRRVPDRRTDNIEVDWIDEDPQILPAES